MHRIVGWGLAILATAALAGCTGGASSSPSPSASASIAAGATPRAAASGPVTVAMGTFHRVDADATGTVALEHLADGSFSIVFEDFKVSTAQHTNVILVPNADVTKDSEIDQTQIIDLGPLKGATGMQDFKVPAEMTANAMSYHTVVLWDTAMKHAIAAAPLVLK
jgi:hypothetical protein